MKKFFLLQINFYPKIILFFHFYKNIYLRNFLIQFNNF
ncbi:hypothetical protein CHAB381_1788 [Campylobacter hominis ATCC BAA-381]|uniref:Uncharacterized protein n=1 Tax=Campylobacter hominis (strain ATCC BAA-381 / DSM 21671 / CCUG 45161 / LMG 19568 / NCTC 13146 / CH001A) TaxID=360107 RepID=A7I457_CAMHC|nr:hypothetical protein CHAB381_1788 [Campylobacter hominis ATCC BAA-381]